MQFPDQAAGSGRALGYQMRLRIEKLVRLRGNLVGWEDALRVAALIEVAVDVHHKFNDGFFYDALMRRVAKKLSTFRPLTIDMGRVEKLCVDIDSGKKQDPLVVQEYLRRAFDQLLDEPPKPCVLLGMELIVLFEMYMSYTRGAAYMENYGVIEARDVKRYHPYLGEIVRRCRQQVEERLVA